MRRNLGILVAFILVGCAWGLWKQVHRTPTTGQDSSSGTAPQTSSPAQPQEEGKVVESAPATASNYVTEPATTRPPETVQAQPNVPRQEPTAYTRQLVAG